MASTGDTVSVALLGEIALRRDGVLAPVPGARSRLLVAALATHPGRSRSAQALIDDVWGDEPPRSPMNALHTQVSRLRSALPEGALEIGPAGYRLLLTADQVDLTCAAHLEQQAREALAADDNKTCLHLVTRARALWRGEPGADLPPGPVADELVQLAADRQQALDALELSAREDAGDLAGAIDLARRAATAHPLDEPAHVTLMRLLAAAGRTTEALDAFATLRTRLVDELGADPGPAIVAVNTAILRGEPLPGVDRARTAEPLRKVIAAQHATPRADRESIAVEALSAIGLRAAPNPLLGRDGDLTALEKLLRTSRVTTILGPGGTGKTRVANELGARLAPETLVALVELASVRPDPTEPSGTRAEVEAAIAATLGIGEASRETNVLRPSRVRDTRQLLREALSSRPMLLILDNCEHLIEAVAEVTADLVGVTDQLTVLTTSRAPLEITAETVYPLPPLTIDAAGSPATDLFTARARAVRPAVRLDPQVVARLCETLDGLPLAIELAAARVRTMSVEEIESRLDRRFALLRSGDRSSPQRHRTLHAVIDWSWNLLDTEQKIALRRLCRFPGGFTLSAAESILAGPEIRDTATAVDGLVGQSLLTVLEVEDDQDGELGHRTRYRMLETVREFGEEQLVAAGEADLVMDRMSVWAVDFALASAGPYFSDDQVHVVLSVAAEVDNLIAVLRYALERRDAATAHAVFPVLALLWVIRGAHMELMSWGPRILDLPLPADPPTRTAADLEVLGQLLLGLHLMFIGSDLRHVAHMRIGLRRLLRSGAELSPVSRFLAEMVTVPTTTRQLARLLDNGARSTDLQTRESALLLRANMRENSGDVYGSIRDAEAALHSLRPGDVWGLAMTCQHLGGMYAQSARYRQAAGYYERSADALHRLRAFEESVEIRSYLGVMLAGLDRTDQARRELEPVLGILGIDPTVPEPVTRPNHRRAVVVAALAEIELAEGNIDSGLERYLAALRLLSWPHGIIAPGPGDIITASAVINAHALYGRAAAVAEIVGQLTEAGVRRLGQYWDVPQIGSVAMAVGSYLLAVGESVDDGIELLALSIKAAARQDYPSMRWERHMALHRPAVGEERMSAAIQATQGLGRRAASERIMLLLPRFAVAIPE